MCRGMLKTHHVFVCQRCEKGISICDDIMSGRKELDVGVHESRDERLEELFVNLAANSTSDHPLCCDCAQANIVELAQVNYETMSETSQYKECLASLHVKKLNVSDLECSDDDILKLQEEEKQLQETVMQLNLELFNEQQPELDQQAWETKKIDLIDERFADFIEKLEYSSLLQYQEELNEDVNKKTYLHHISDNWEDSGEYIPFLFRIGNNGYFGTINDLRLGTTREHPVDWEEVNAAWGLTALMLNDFGKRCSCSFKKVIPRGSFSIVERRSDKSIFELYGSKEISINTLFWFGRFDEAMIAFLGCLSELCEFVHKNDPHFAIPYSIRGDKIGKYSLKYHRLGNNVEWVIAQRLILETLKRLQLWDCDRQKQTNK